MNSVVHTSCPDPTSTSQQEAAEWLTAAGLDESTPIIVRHWDDPDWEQVWSLHIFALRNHPDRRHYLHDVARISFQPIAARFPSYCNLIRLKWAGYAGNGHCEAEEEVIEWADDEIRSGKDETVIYKIICIITGWERDLEEPLRTAIRDLCDKSPSADIRKAAIRALVVHAPPDRKTSDEQPVQYPAENGVEDHRLDGMTADLQTSRQNKLKERELQRIEEGKNPPLSVKARKKTQKIVIPQLTPEFDRLKVKPTYNDAEAEQENGERGQP